MGDQSYRGSLTNPNESKPLVETLRARHRGAGVQADPRVSLGSRPFDARANQQLTDALTARLRRDAQHADGRGGRILGLRQVPTGWHIGRRPNNRAVELSYQHVAGWSPGAPSRSEAS